MAQLSMVWLCAQAWLSILLAVFVIAELTIFIGVLNETAVTLLVAPLARILTVLRTQAARVMKSMERSEARGCSCQVKARMLVALRLHAHAGTRGVHGHSL